MSFETYNKGNINKSDSVNTRGLQMKNRKGFDASTLVLQYWDNKLNVILHPQLSNPTEKQVYDYEKKIMITLQVDKAEALLKAAELILDKAIDESKETSVAITTGSSNNMLVLSTVLHEGLLNVVLTVCREINPENKLPGQRFSYTFIKDDEVVTGYDPKNGEFENVIVVQSEYELFKRALKEYIDMSCQAQVHSDRFYDKFYRNGLMDRVTKTGVKVGAIDSGNYSRSYGGNTSSFANVNNQGSVNPNEYTPTSTLDDLDDVF